MKRLLFGVMGHVVLVVVGCGASIFFPNRDAAAKEMTLRGWRRRKEGQT